MEIREVFLEERYQNGLWICSSGDKMGSSVPDRGKSMSKGIGASASWWCCQGTLGNSRERTEGEEANSGDRFLQATLGILDFTLSQT